MLKQLVTKVMGTRFERELKRIQPIVDAIHGHEERLKGLSEADLQAQTASFRARLAERVGALTADVTRLKQEKHDCPDAEQRVALDRKLGEAEKRLAQETQAGLSHLLPEAFATVPCCRKRSRPSAKRPGGSWAPRRWSPATPSNGTWCRTTSS